MIEIVWQLKDVLVATWFTTIETTTFLVAPELALSTQDGLWFKLTLG
jgi:hypothetical protein